MEQNKDINQFDIPLAKRTYLKKPNSILLKKLLIFSPFLFLICSLAAVRVVRILEEGPLLNLNATEEKRSKRNGANIKNFFNNLEFELFKWVLLARGISN